MIPEVTGNRILTTHKNYINFYSAVNSATFFDKLVSTQESVMRSFSIKVGQKIKD